MAEGGASRQIHLAAQEIEAVNAVATLVNRVQAVVTIKPLDGVLTGVTVATQNLDGVLIGL